MGADEQVFLDRQRGKQPAPLGHHGDAAHHDVGRRQRADRLPVQRNRAARAHKPVIERISVDLPAPLAPMIATLSPASRVDIDAEQRLEIAVVGGQLRDFEQRHQASIPR